MPVRLREIGVAPSLGQAHSIQHKLVDLKGQFQTAGRAHRAPNRDWPRIQAAQSSVQRRGGIFPLVGLIAQSIQKGRGSSGFDHQDVPMTNGVTVSLLATSWRAGQQGPVWLPYPSFPEQV